MAACLVSYDTTDKGFLKKKKVHPKGFSFQWEVVESFWLSGGCTAAVDMWLAAGEIKENDCNNEHFLFIVKMGRYAGFKPKSYCHVEVPCDNVILKTPTDIKCVI